MGEPAKPFETQTDDKKGSVVDDKLKPTAEMHILVGGPYGDHRYGHTALRIKSSKSDLTYDFGRYGRTNGEFSAEGEGILRVWLNFDTYISDQNALKRKTTDFIYRIFEYQAESTNKFYSDLISTGKRRTDLEGGRSAVKIYLLPQNYHGLGYNCTTQSLDGASKVFSDFEKGSSEFIKPDEVLTLTERVAMKTLGGGTPARLFLPANLQKFLSNKPAVKPDSIVTYGG